MKILHLNYSDLNGGAAKASYRIHRGLIDAGVDSRMLVIDKVSDDRSVEEASIQKKLSCKVKNRISKQIARLNKSQNPILHSLNLFPSRFYKTINRSEADIVHLHWVNRELIDIKGIKKIEKPIVWTLHDSWAFSGAEHYLHSYDDNRFKEGYSSKNRIDGDKGLDIDRWTWRRKEKHWKNKKFYVITPSHWLGALAKESVLFKHNPVHTIHNGLDLNLFNPLDKSDCRKTFNLANNKTLLGFGVFHALDDPRKGLHFLMSSLKELPASFKEHAELVIIGSSRPMGEIDFGLKTHYLGYLFDELSLACFYSAIDIFVCPSVLENLSNMLVESISCGTPCIAFNSGGTNDIIDHMEDGYLAKSFESNDLAAGIEWIHNKKGDNDLCQKARNKAKAKFDINKVARQYKELYENILASLT